MNWTRINCIRRFLRTGWLKSLFFNFSMLPFKQAMKMPIILARNTHLYSLGGNIVFDNNRISFGMVRLGYFGEDTLPYRSNRIILKIDGTCYFAKNIHFGIGTSIRVEKGGKLCIGENVRISNLSKIVCYESINIGNNCRIAWESQIIDTNFHYMRAVETGAISELNKPISIGNNCWIGNRTTIMKGAVLPDFTIVASGSLLNKLYNIPNYSLLAGSPAKMIKTGVVRCLDEEEKQIKMDLKK